MSVQRYGQVLSRLSRFGILARVFAMTAAAGIVLIAVGDLTYGAWVVAFSGVALYISMYGLLRSRYQRRVAKALSFISQAEFIRLEREYGLQQELEHIAKLEPPRRRAEDHEVVLAALRDAIPRAGRPSQPLAGSMDRWLNTYAALNAMDDGGYSVPSEQAYVVELRTAIDNLRAKFNCISALWRDRVHSAVDLLQRTEPPRRHTQSHQALIDGLIRDVDLQVELTQRRGANDDMRIIELVNARTDNWRHVGAAIQEIRGLR